MKLFTQTDLERCAHKALTIYADDPHHSVPRAVREAVRHTMSGEPPLFDANSVRDIADRVYTFAQDHYREQTCDPVMAIEKAIAEALDEQGETE